MEELMSWNALEKMGFPPLNKPGFKVSRGVWAKLREQGGLEPRIQLLSPEQDPLIRHSALTFPAFIAEGSSGRAALGKHGRGSS